jgi:2-polyprenyl-3-methyl-5-hydroxy-6-metoxy-1,4-benzoquinol methylase
VTQINLPIETMVQATCPICDAGDPARTVQLTDLLVGTPGSWNMWRCANAACDANWLNPRPSDDDFDRLYEAYYTHGTTPSREHTWWPSPWAARAALRRKSIVSADIAVGRVLEIGCGNGRNLAALAAQGWEVFGQDIDVRAAEEASAILGRQVESLPIERCSFELGSFDVVLTNHTLEHVARPVELLRSARNFLRPGGVSINYTPNGASLQARAFRSAWRGYEAPRHLVLLGPQAGQIAMLEAGFHNVVVTTANANAGVIAADSLWLKNERRLSTRTARASVQFSWQILEDLVTHFAPLLGWEMCLCGNA